MKKLTSMVLALLILLCACAKAPTWQEQYDLGVRYLSDGNYQEAIIAFTAAIEIDPKRADAYLSAAEAYLAVGDQENAEIILQRGLDATADDRLEDMLEQIAILRMFTPEMITPEDLCVEDVPFWEYPITNIPALYPSDYESFSYTPGEITGSEETGYHYSVMKATVDGGWTLGWTAVLASQNAGAPGLTYIHYVPACRTDNGVEWSGYPMFIRGLEEKMSRRDALEALGLSEEGIETLMAYDDDAWLTRLSSGEWLLQGNAHDPEDAQKKEEYNDYTEAEVSNVRIKWYGEEFWDCIELDFIQDQLCTVTLERDDADVIRS